MTQYHLKYKNIKPAVIKAVRTTIIEDKFFRSCCIIKYFMLKGLLIELCNIYDISNDKKPSLTITEENTDGYYNHFENIIVLNEKLSLVTFLHEFKHFLQIHFNKPNSEEIARAYSLSLFYLASEKHFKRAVKKGLILHQKEI